MNKNQNYKKVFILGLVLSLFDLPCLGQDQLHKQCDKALSYDDLVTELHKTTVNDIVEGMNKDKVRVKFLWCSKYTDSLKLVQDKQRYLTNEDISNLEDAVESNYCWPKTVDQTIRLRGSTTVGHILAPMLSYQYLKKGLKAGEVTIISDCDGWHTRVIGYVHGDGWISFDILPTGSVDAESQLLAGKAEIGMASTKLDNKKLIGFISELLASDELSVIVNKINPIDKIDIEALQKIVRSGQKNRDPRESILTNWSQLDPDISIRCGGNDKIVFYSREKGSGSLTDFLLAIGLIKQKSDLFELGLPSNQIVHDHLDMAYSVAKDACGIGYVAKSYAGIAKPIAVDIPKEKKVGLQHSLYFYHREREAYPIPAIGKTVEGFMLYTMESQRGQQDIADMGYDAPNLNSNPDNEFDCHTNRLPDGTPIDSPILFAPEKYAIDADGIKSLKKLREYIPKTAREVWVVGFTDNTGSDNTNKTLSENRATTVKQKLVEENNRANIIHAKGCGVRFFGNGTKDGRAKNRAVEVWWR